MPDIKVVTRNEITGVLEIGISRPPQYISGIDLLVQIVVLELLHSPGRSIIDPESGGNLRSLIGSNFDDEGEIYADVKMMINTVEKNIRAAQESTNRPSNEKLAKLVLMDIVPDEEQALLEIMLRVVSMDQQTSDAIVGLK